MKRIKRVPYMAFGQTAEWRSLIHSSEASFNARASGIGSLATGICNMFWNAWFQTCYIDIYLHIPIVLRLEMHDFKHTIYVNMYIYILQIQSTEIVHGKLLQYAYYMRNTHSPNMMLVSNFFTKQKIQETSNACESCHSHPPSRCRFTPSCCRFTKQPLNSWIDSDASAD